MLRLIDKAMDSTRGRSNRNTALQSQTKRESPSRWSKDELFLFGDQRSHRRSPMNYDYDFPIEKWSERRIAAEKRQNEKASPFKTKPSSRWNHTTTQPSKDPQKPVSAGNNPLLTLCSLINHCEAISDFEQFKGHSLIAVLMSRPIRADPTQQGTVKKDGDKAKYGEAAHHVTGASTARDVADDGSKSQADHKASSSTLRRKISSADPEVTSRDAGHPPRSSSSERLCHELSSAALARSPTSYENENSDSLEHFYSDSVSHCNSFHDENSMMFHKSRSMFSSKQQKLGLPVRFYYTRLNAAVQGRLDQLNQHGAIASLVWKSPVHPPLPLLTSQVNSHHHNTSLVQSSPRYFHLSSTCALNGYHTNDTLSSGALSKPMTEQSVLTALARVRFQTEGPNASAILLPPAHPPSRQVTKKLCDEQQREASAELEARGLTCVMHDSSSVNVDAMSKTQLFHIGDLLQAMDSNRKRETTVPLYLNSTDVSL